MNRGNPFVSRLSRFSLIGSFLFILVTVLLLNLAVARHEAVAADEVGIDAVTESSAAEPPAPQDPTPAPTPPKCLEIGPNGEGHLDCSVGTGCGNTPRGRPRKCQAKSDSTGCECVEVTPRPRREDDPVTQCE